ncbi:MAG: hypothetical protein QOE76_2132 [Frankiales bacterium]|nr:hypothetical protein [Frankiales bacterium]
MSRVGDEHGAAPSPAAFWPSRTVCLAARCLPKGTVRERYRAEFLAELPDLTNRQQIRHAARVLAHAGTLCMTVTSGETLGKEETTMHTRTASRLVLCGLNLHHQWRWHATEDGQRYRQCFRCGKDDEERNKGPHGDGSPYGNGMIPLG